jgi:hypothetical protein
MCSFLRTSFFRHKNIIVWRNRFVDDVSIVKRYLISIVNKVGYARINSISTFVPPFKFNFMLDVQRKAPYVYQ